MRWVLALLIPLLAACREDPPEALTPPAPAPVAVPVPAPDPALERQRAEFEAERDVLRTRIQAARRRTDAAEKALDELLQRQQHEIVALGDFAHDRAKQRDLLTKVKSARNRMAYYEQRLGPVDPQIAALVGKVQELDAEQDRLEEQLEERRRAAAKMILTAELVESPVAKDLRSIRAVEDRWLELTREARAKRPGFGVRKRVNDDFRAYVDAEPDRRRLVESALADAERAAPYDRYDFTRFDFFVFCQALEDDLDRRNVTVERDRLAEARKEMDRIADAVDAVVGRRAELERDPSWPRVQETLDSRGRLDVIQTELDIAQRRLDEVEERLAPYLEMRRAHDEARTAAETELAAAREELAAAEKAWDAQ